MECFLLHFPSVPSKDILHVVIELWQLGVKTHFYKLL